MVTTRRSAAAQPRDSYKAESQSSDTANGSQATGRRVARKSAPIVAISNFAKKRNRGDPDTAGPPAKKPALGRPRKPRIPKAPPRDEHEDQVPDDPTFFEYINATASGKSSAKRQPKASQPGDEDIAAREEPLREGQSRRQSIWKPAAVQDLHEGETRSREESSLFVEQRGADEDEGEAQENRSDEEDAEERDEDRGADVDEDEVEENRSDEEHTEEREEEDGNSDDGMRAQETTSSAITDSSSTNKLEHITRIDSISTDLAYIEPEPQGKTALTFSINCDGFNSMIKAMGKQGWMNIKGDWTDELLIVEESENEWRSRHAKVMTAGSCLKLFLQSIELWKFCKAMPKAPAFGQQGEFLRSRSPSLENHLNAMKRSVELVLADASKPAESNPKQKKKKKKAQRTKAQAQQVREKKDEEKRAQQIFTCIYIRLIPALVLALKEALLLGGYSRLDIISQPETIAVRDGRFMACALQIALRIVGFIDLLYDVVLSTLTVENESESEPATNTQQQKQRMVFGKHLGVLKQRILGAMEELRFRAEAPLRQAKMKEQTRLIQKANEEADQEILDNRRKQMMLFVASTQRVAEKVRLGVPRDEYYSKHGWYLREDEILLGGIRNTSRPDFDVLARGLPNRTLADIKTRVQRLRDLMKTKYEAADIQPPKWCYY